MWSCCWTFVGATYSKLSNSGLRWCDGRTIQWSVGKDVGMWPFLIKFCQKNLWFCSLLSIITLIVEGLVILMCFFNNLRLPFCVILVGFHVGIKLVMAPQFFPQCVCYILMVNWSDYNQTIYQLRISHITSTISPFFIFLTVLLFLILTIIYIIVNFGKIDYYPFTSIPMYSMYRGGYPRMTIKDKQQLNVLVDEFMKNRYHFPLSWNKTWFPFLITDNHSTIDARYLFQNPLQGADSYRSLGATLVCLETRKPGSGKYIFQLFINGISKYKNQSKYKWLNNKIIITLNLRIDNNNNELLRWEGYLPD